MKNTCDWCWWLYRRSFGKKLFSLGYKVKAVDIKPLMNGSNL